MTSRPPASLGRSSVYRVEAIILRHRDLGEADRVVTAYTRQHGKLRVSARGARRPKSKLGGHVEPLTRASLQIVRGRTLDIITQAQASETFPNVRADLTRLMHGLHMAELTDHFTQEEEPQAALFEMLLEALRRLDGGTPPEGLARAFEIQILEQVGYRPVLDRCVSCEQPLTGETGGMFFSASWGGISCATCRNAQTEWTRAVTPSTLQQLQLLQARGLDAAAEPVIADSGGETESLLRWYLHYVLERPLETITFLDQLRAGRGV